MGKPSRPTFKPPRPSGRKGLPSRLSQPTKKSSKSIRRGYEIYRHLGDLNAERGLLSSAVQDYLTLGKFYLKEGRSKEALDIYRKIVSQDPSELSMRSNESPNSAFRKTPVDEAIKVYFQLGRERSASTALRTKRSEAYMAALAIWTRKTPRPKR